MAAIKKRISSSLGDRLFMVLVYLFVFMFVVITAFPVYNVFVLSFNEGADAERGGIYLWPREFTLDNYKAVFNNSEFLVAGGTTILRTLVGTLTGLVFTALFSYALSRPDIMFRRFYVVMGAITMYFNGGLIPNYLLILNIGLFDSFWVYIIPMLFNMSFTLILISFFRAIPFALIESAKIDGAGEYRIFFQIIAPLSLASFATVGLFIAVQHWNTWFDTMVYTRDPQLITLPFLFMRMVESADYLEEAIRNTSDPQRLETLKGMLTVNSRSLQYACMTVALFPIAVTYPFLQKYFVKGVMVGSLKA